MPQVRTRRRPLGTVRPPAQDLDVARMRIRGERRTAADVRKLISDATLETTIEGASTLTLVVADPTRAFLRSTLARTGAEVTVDNIDYRLVKVSHDTEQVTLIYEELAVSLLRRYNKPRKSSRANTTRSQFIQGLVREVRERQVPFSCPELRARQRIARRGS